MIIEYRHLPSTSFLKQPWAGGVCSIGEDLQAVHLSHFLSPFAVDYSKQRCHAMSEGIWSKEAERSSVIKDDR